MTGATSRHVRSALLPDVAAARDAFAHSARPRLMELLRAIGLDVVYERGLGDTLFHREERGEEVAVLDLLGGYGASLLGHNHPALVARAREILDEGRPTNAQASARGLAGRLCERLSERVGRATGKSYVVTLANSGAEAVEAAIKHAEIEMALRIDRILDRLKRTFKEVRLRLRDHTAYLPEALFEKSARLLAVPRIRDLEELDLRLFRHALDAFEREPSFLALEGAFHGKTTGALKLTHNPDYRSPWRRIGLHVEFLPVGDEAAIASFLEAARVPYLDLEIGESGEVEVIPRDLVNVSACFVEPIQGEGGIREVPAGYLRALRAAADAGGFPLVMDEIQSGMGRTGTFLASEPSSVRGDYYLLSKTLGGGLAKISALLVERERYVSEYGYLHTSTFAEDDFASAIALSVMDEIERDGDRVLDLCRSKGEHLLARLAEVKASYPSVIADVRGRGLMVGVELAPQDSSPSPLLRVLSKQGLLGFVVAGHLLAEERIRVAPALSSHGTLRLEPSAFIETADLDRFADALARVAEAIASADSFRLARFIAGRRAGAPRVAQRETPAFISPGWSPPRHSRKVAFLGHFLEPRDLGDWDRGLSPLEEAESARFLDRTRGLLEPFLVERRELRSIRGDTVSITVIGLPFTALQAMESHRRGESAWVVELVEKGVELARHHGCALVGFGGYTSIVTDNCRSIVEDEIAVTSGNSLTAAAALEALRHAARESGIESARLAVVGAAGNIGGVLAEVAADHVGDILLLGRPGATRRLQAVAAEVYFGAYKRLIREESLEGLAGAISRTATVRALRRDGDRGLQRVGEAIRAGIEEELGEWAPVRVSTDMAALRRSNLIITATNAARPVITSEHLGEGPVVICDVATPQDVDPTLATERPDVVVIRGGLVRAPLGQRLDIGGMPLKDGQVYGCLAETVLLGFATFGEHFSYGRLTATLVRRIRELARMHGFKVEAQRAW